jgi:transcriptional regulator MraZ
MFRGRYEHTIDVKGRLALPSTFKKELQEKQEEELIVTTHISSPCLVAYPIDEWRRFEDRLAKLPQFEPSVMMLRRLYVGGAMECAIDKQGRVLIPPVLREYAKLERDAYVVGAMRTMEIWSKQAWQDVVEKARETVTQDVLTKLGELGI